MRWQLIALYVIIGHGGLPLKDHESVDAITEVVVRWQADVSRLLALCFFAIPGCSIVPNRRSAAGKIPEANLALEKEGKITRSVMLHS
jgi:hypothetical protein